jgi:hypothetical protein
VFEYKNAITIIEVKSGKYYHSHASLDSIIKEQKLQNKKINKSIVFSKYNIESTEDINYLPFYMILFLFDN